MHDAQVFIWDETLRDGEQTPGVSLSIEQKVEIAKALDELKVDVISAGFPAVSKDEFEAVKRITSLNLNARIGVTVRTSQEDIDCAIRTNVKEIHMFIPTSDILLKYKLGISKDEALLRTTKMIDYALKHDLTVTFVAEDSTRTDRDFLLKILKASYEYGANIGMVTDTVGNTLPYNMYKLIKHLRTILPIEFKLGVHCHNDFGLATANSLAAMEGGAQYITGTINGIGERAGNASLEELIMAIKLLYKHNLNINTNLIKKVSRLVEIKSGIPVSSNKPIVGFNAFRHESGIHVKAMLENNETYEIIPPELVGRTRNFVLGKHSGKGYLTFLNEKYQLGLNNEEIIGILEHIKRASSMSKDSSMVNQLNEYYQKIGVDENEFFRIFNDFIKDVSL
ncbi:homoaconitate hydratase [Lysinibacillus fusiformis]|nr:homoaconitate hydratase [Lysinibacillus fusiformis]